MAYKIKGKNGLPIKKDGQFLLGYDIPETKIEQMDEKNLSFIAVGSTEDEDRDKDIVRIDGWKLQNFNKNPVLPWSHNYYEPPVGKAISIKKDKAKKKLIFKAQFDADDDKARLIFNKYKNGFLNTFSVGFLGLEFNWRDEENRWCGGREFIKQELLEISCVTVPSNPNANMDVRSLTDDLPPNLVQLGYKQFACITESGLFIPVTDTEIYTSANIMDISKGIKGLFGTIIDNPDAKQELVGYIFDENKEEKEAQEWVSNNASVISRVKYFDMGSKTICEDEFELDVVEEEITVGEIKEVNELENNVEEETVEVEEETEEKEIDVEEENIENKEVEEENTEEKNEEAAEEKEVQSDDAAEENLIEENKQDDLDTIAAKVFEKIKVLLIESKILVEKEEEIDNTENTNSVVELSDETESSKNGDVIEFDSSMFTPVIEEDNSENFIEIDDKVFDDVKLQMKTPDVRKTLEETIKQVMQEFSGKLD